jgi:hypothetical protein
MYGVMRSKYQKGLKYICIVLVWNLMISESSGFCFTCIWKVRFRIVYNSSTVAITTREDAWCHVKQVACAVS